MLANLHLSELQHRIATLGDALAFKELFSRFQPALKKFAFSICQVQEEAEEAVLDVFIRIWERRKTLDQIHNLKLFLYISTRNYSLNYVRNRQKSQGILSIEEMKVELDSFVADPQQLLIGREMQQKLLHAINGLPPQCRVIFKLVKEDGLRQREVAELLHLQPKTVENQLAIAIRKIGQTLMGEKEVAGVKQK